MFTWVNFIKIVYIKNLNKLNKLIHTKVKPNKSDNKNDMGNPRLCTY